MLRHIPLFGQKLLAIIALSVVLAVVLVIVLIVILIIALVVVLIVVRHEDHFLSQIFSPKTGQIYNVLERY